MRGSEEASWRRGTWGEPELAVEQGEREESMEKE